MQTYILNNMYNVDSLALISPWLYHVYVTMHYKYHK